MITNLVIYLLASGLFSLVYFSITTWKHLRKRNPFFLVLMLLLGSTIFGSILTPAIIGKIIRKAISNKALKQNNIKYR